MNNWERQWCVMLIFLRYGSVKLQKLIEECEASSSTIRADIAHLSLTFPIESQRGRNGCYYLSCVQRPFARHAKLLAKIEDDAFQYELSDLDKRLIQEAIIALLSIKGYGRNSFSL